MKKILLISNRVMHYRVSLYNYFHAQFKNIGVRFIVRSNKLQQQNANKVQFDFKEIEFNFKKYKQEIDTIQPDVVILFLHHKDKIYWPIAHWIKLKRIPFIYWNKALNYDRKDNLISNFLFRYMHSLADRIILYMNSEKQYISLQNRYKVYPANNTINFKDFPEIAQTKAQIKKELGIKFKKVVLSVGRMSIDGGRKKISLLIDLFRTRKGDDVGLVIVGSGMTSELTRRINPINTISLGEVHDSKNIQISKIFTMADVFCLPEHVGLGINQAFYFGLPIVTMEGNQPPEINYLINGRNGFIVPNGNIKELERKLFMLIENDEMLTKFGNNARNDILKNGSPNNMFTAFKNCIESLSI